MPDEIAGATNVPPVLDPIIRLEITKKKKSTVQSKPKLAAVRDDAPMLLAGTELLVALVSVGSNGGSSADVD